MNRLVLALPLLMSACMSTNHCRELLAAVAEDRESVEGAQARIDELERRQVGWLDIGFGVAGIGGPAATALWIARNQTRKRWTAQHPPLAHSAQHG